MVKGTALFGHPDDPDAFEEYYASTHVPLVKKIPNVQRFEAARIVATPDGSEPPYYRIGELYFEDVEQMQAGPYRGISLATSTIIVRLYELLNPIDDLKQHFE
jgi:uncharacterized protein (TIGR02118 family)